MAKNFKTHGGSWVPAGKNNDLHEAYVNAPTCNDAGYESWSKNEATVTYGDLDNTIVFNNNIGYKSGVKTGVIVSGAIVTAAAGVAYLVKKYKSKVKEKFLNLKSKIQAKRQAKKEKVN